METGGMNFLFYLLHMIVQTRSGKLSWTRLRNIISIEDPLARELSTGICRTDATKLINCHMPY